MTLSACVCCVQKVAVQTTEKSYITTEKGYISSNSRGTLAAANERALVIYLYTKADPVHQNNLNYFIQHGISANDGCDYVVVVHGAEATQVTLFYLLRFGDIFRADLNRDGADALTACRP